MFAGVGVACSKSPVIQVSTDRTLGVLPPGLGLLCYASGPSPVLAQSPPPPSITAGAQQVFANSGATSRQLLLTQVK